MVRCQSPRRRFLPDYASNEFEVSKEFQDGSPLKYGSELRRLKFFSLWCSWFEGGVIERNEFLNSSSNGFALHEGATLLINLSFQWRFI
jgi:hypothetical protein